MSFLAVPRFHPLILPPEMTSMIAQVAIAALTLSGGVYAFEEKTNNQLETPRLTQSAQRTEFGIEGPDSAFKFSFSDSVRFPAFLAFSPTKDDSHAYNDCICRVLYGLMLSRMHNWPRRQCHVATTL